MSEKINVKELKNLFAKIKNNNNTAFEELYSKYSKLIYKIAYSILKNKSDAEDVMQLVFEKIYSMDKENLPTKNETSWIYSVTKNETLNYFKSNRNNINLDDIYEIEDNNQEISKIIDQENYNRLISKLNDNEKEIISLKIISNFSFEEIGKILNMPTGTVKWRYYKAINTLKLLLSNLTMFIISFISSIYALKSTKKIISPIQEENVIENIVIAADENQKQQYEKSENTQQNSQEEINTTIIEETNENEVNYPAIGLMGISTVFLMLTIIFSIIFAKYQLKLKKNLSK
ncbi:rNA polymerase sigma-24 subunit ECF subfamily [Clostridium sp. CAG:793]|nr:rNA polymerase sigma-24 subunit ECF subfamily [Clostridium sp. CAG:793]